MSLLLIGAGITSLSAARCYGKECIALEESDHGIRRHLYDPKDKLFHLDQLYPNQRFDDYDFKEESFDRVLISPGIDPKRSFVRPLLGRELRELDWFSDEFRGFKIVVTGTNGKSSFVHWLGQLLRMQLGHDKVFVGGNIGLPMLDVFSLTPKPKVAVLEVSSFQAERLRSAEFDLAVLLNISPDHLNRYDSVEEYYSAKYELLRRATNIFYPQDAWKPSDFEKSSELAFNSNISAHALLGVLMQKLSSELGVEKKDQDFESLQPLAHRLERRVAEDGVILINDSKATNVNAVVYALKKYKRSSEAIKLILGGLDKGDDFQKIKPLLKPKDQVLLYGESKGKIQQQLSDIPQLIRVYSSLKSLMEDIRPQLKSGDELMLSPGCASFDEFKNFGERGEFFLSFL